MIVPPPSAKTYVSTNALPVKVPAFDNVTVFVPSAALIFPFCATVIVALTLLPRSIVSTSVVVAVLMFVLFVSTFSLIVSLPPAALNVPDTVVCVSVSITIAAPSPPPLAVTL